MPIYVYECERGHVMEEWQGINDPPYEMLIHGTVPDVKLSPENPLMITTCLAPVRRIIVGTNGHVMDPTGVYQPAPGKDKYGRQNETKITKRQFEKNDQKLRAEMLELAKTGPRLDLAEKKSSRWV